MRSILLLILLACGGCGFFDKEKIPLEGRRVPLTEVPLLSQPSIKARSFLEEKEPDFLNSTQWLQAGYNAAHLMGPFQLSRSLTLSHHFPCPMPPSQISVAPIATSKAIFVLTSDGRVCSFDFQGRCLWDVPLAHEGVMSWGGGLASSGAAIYVTTSWGELIALDIHSGKVLWRQALSVLARNAPAVFEGRIFVLTLKNKLEVFDAQTGKALWDHSGLTEEISLLGSSVPSAQGERVIVAYSSGEVVALSLNDGEVIWLQSGAPLKSLGEAQKLGHIKALPVISGSQVYTVSYNGQLSCFDFTSGEPQWTYPLGGVQTPLKVGATLFCLSSDQKLVALHAYTGQLLWEVKTNGMEAGPIMAGGLLYCVGGKYLSAFDPARKGQCVATYALEEPCELAPLVVNGQLVLLGKLGTIYIFQGLETNLRKLRKSVP